MEVFPTAPSPTNTHFTVCLHPGTREAGSGESGPAPEGVALFVWPLVVIVVVIVIAVATGEDAGPAGEGAMGGGGGDDPT